MNGINSANGDRQAFGAQVVTATMNKLNNSGSEAAPTDKESFGAAVVSKTLDYMNQNQHRNQYRNAVSDSYDFNKDVLSGALENTGSIINTES